LTQGNCCINEMTVLQNGGVPGFTPNASSHPGVAVGGRIYRARVLANDSAGTLANGPLWSSLIAALPGIIPVSQ